MLTVNYFLYLQLFIKLHETCWKNDSRCSANSLHLLGRKIIHARNHHEACRRHNLNFPTDRWPIGCCDMRGHTFPFFVAVTPGLQPVLCDLWILIVYVRYKHCNQTHLNLKRLVAIIRILLLSHQTPSKGE
jgi:hypothetical protein